MIENRKLRLFAAVCVIAIWGFALALTTAHKRAALSPTGALAAPATIAAPKDSPHRLPRLAKLVRGSVRDLRSWFVPHS